jgi:hypothetical protein
LTSLLDVINKYKIQVSPTSPTDEVRDREWRRNRTSKGEILAYSVVHAEKETEREMVWEKQKQEWEAGKEEMEMAKKELKREREEMEKEKERWWEELKREREEREAERKRESELLREAGTALREARKAGTIQL